jgi:hypothetical protein
LPAAAPTPWTYPRTFGPGDVHGVLRDFKFAALAEGDFFSSRGLWKMFAKCYFNNPTHVTLPQSSRASCLGIVSLEAHSQVAAAALLLLPCARNANLKLFVKHLPNTCLFKTHKILKYLVAQEHFC